MSGKHITMAHGSGGLQSQSLLNDVIFEALGIKDHSMDDSALLSDLDGNSLAFTTDSFVVQPLEFPGGDIGRLAVCGTINDLSTCGATPLALSLAFIIEEGFEIERISSICRSIAATAAEAGVTIATGDTKVIERQSGDGLFINTSGIGVLSRPPLRMAHARPDDAILISGTIADHGTAIMAARADYGIMGQFISDAAPLNDLADRLLEAVPRVHVLKDPTRGGVAMALHEISKACNAKIEIEESALPILPQVQSFCDLLGFDPLEIANEGKLLVVCPAEDTEVALASMRTHPLGTNSALIGRVLKADRPQVTMRTKLGGTRVVGIPAGELLPRIC